MKAILISIKPKWVADILNGKKTIEIRKTMPKCDLPIDVYIYCTKDKKYVNLVNRGGFLTGMVVAKFTLNKIRTSDMTNCLQGSCLSYDKVNEYTKGKKFYGWAIDNLIIFDRPKELSEFKTRHYPQFAGMVRNKTHYELKPLTKAPQSFCYIEVEDE